MQTVDMDMQIVEAPRGVTVRLADDVRQRVAAVARAEHRSTAAYIESLVDRDLAERAERARVVTVYAAWDAPAWSGAVDRGVDETDAEHADRSAVLKQLFGRD